MRIGVNALFLIPGKVGGSEIYVRNLLKNLAAIDRKNEYILFTNKENSGTFGISQANFREVHCPIKASFRPARILWEQLILPLQVRKYDIDVLHSPGYIAPVRVFCHSIVTIHDVNYFYYPEDFSKLSVLFLKVLVPLSARKSDKIIAISKNSKKDIMKILKIPESKICIIYQAGDTYSSLALDENTMMKKLREEYGINRKFILTVSASHPHKNLHRLIRAYDILRRNHTIEHRLVLVGIRGRAQSLLLDLITKLSLQKSVIFTGWIPGEDIPLLYSAADLFVFPSLFEGFGNPVLEAMACGTPVVCSNVTSLPEVVGEAAILINPYHVDEIAEAMYKVLTDQTLRATLIKKGLKRASQFSWKRTARETLAVYKRACKQK